MWRRYLQVDEDINWVAGWEVHRHYGESKRLAEAEKKLLQKIIAERTQVTLSAWIKQKDSTEEDLRCINSICGGRDKMAAEVSDNTRKFVDANKGRLRNPAMLVSRQSVLSQYGCKEVNKTQIQVSLKTMATVTKRTFYLKVAN
ncbi:hypothetical protein NP493_124g01022 [Ridgeia piscesae]|uniref:Uncharacterized protein n=1 Tax=Ridgeia piscesae TaxID=27915 RepID=A0AAD9P683_RIDPI|nr:hypothetical protein NP493_124g01022 [Ridgeia piscesae]